MGLKKNAETPSRLEDNYRFHDNEYNHWVFVGNINQHKNTFIAISVIWLKNDIGINSTLSSFPKTADDFVPATER
jgi:hypothetical protein